MRHASVLLASLALVVACKSDKITATTGTGGGSIALAIGGGSITLAPGGTASLPVVITRNGGYTGSVSITPGTLPLGITTAVTPGSITSGQRIATVVFTATPTVTAGTYTTSLVAAGTGVTQQSQPVTIVVAPTSQNAIVLTASPSAFVVTAGQSITTAVSVSRGGTLAGNVTLTLENAPTGMTLTSTPSPVTGNSASVTIAAASTVAPGLYQVRVRGTAGATSGTADLTIIVQ